MQVSLANQKTSSTDSANSPSVQTTALDVLTFAQTKDISLNFSAFDETKEAAALFDNNLKIIAANSTAKSLLEVDELRFAVEKSLTQNQNNQTINKDNISLVISSVCLSFELFITPISYQNLPAYLVFIKDTSMENNLRDALIESRSRYKDFVSISADFAWETDAEGKFIFISPKNAAWNEAKELINQKPEKFLLNLPNSKKLSPFSPEQPLEKIEVWVRKKSGTLACLSVSSLPIFNSEGKKIGARGVCTDVTDLRELDVIVAQARERERLLGRIIRGFRDESNPKEMLACAASAICEELKIAACEIYRYGGLSPDDKHNQNNFTTIIEYGNLPPKNIVTPVFDRLKTGENINEVIGNWAVIGCATEHKKEKNGLICLWRKTEENINPWIGDEKVLVADIAVQIGVAIAQVVQHEHILTLSRTDPLTQLYNRRAFFEEAKRRYERLEFSHEDCAIFYIDLDNFKQVNDTHGHQKGDEALIAVSNILRSITRPSDLIARLGGDEFALWLEGISPKAAEEKAKLLLEKATELDVFSGSKEKPLSFSIGVAVSDDEKNEDMNQFLQRADSAMYQAKNAGKSNFCMA